MIEGIGMALATVLAVILLAVIAYSVLQILAWATDPRRREEAHAFCSGCGSRMGYYNSHRPGNKLVVYWRCSKLNNGESAERHDIFYVKEINREPNYDAASGRRL